ncbi:MAG: hypothetical protein UR22_C0025G0002 [Parcubacteria group bacterium GW2011_GWC2_32_10]|nr:MAG: hypothetical protein UR22_C0025G0002 [Parcubacteria group bacterium GW2011_GWC2_32_10]
MNKDYKELIKYLDQKFGKTENDFNELKDNFNLLQTLVDAYTVKADTYF